MVGAQVQVGGRNSPHTPLGLGRECGCLMVGRGGGDDLVSVLVDCPRGGCSHLRLLFGLFLNLSNLLSLGTGSRDLHAEDDVPGLGLCQRADIDTVMEEITPMSKISLQIKQKLIQK